MQRFVRKQRYHTFRLQLHRLQHRAIGRTGHSCKKNAHEYLHKIDSVQMAIHSKSSAMRQLYPHRVSVHKRINPFLPCVDLTQVVPRDGKRTIHRRILRSSWEVPMIGPLVVDVVESGRFLPNLVQWLVCPFENLHQRESHQRLRISCFERCKRQEHEFMDKENIPPLGISLQYDLSSVHQFRRLQWAAFFHSSLGCTPRTKLSSGLCDSQIPQTRSSDHGL